MGPNLYLENLKHLVFNYECDIPPKPELDAKVDRENENICFHFSKSKASVTQK